MTYYRRRTPELWEEIAAVAAGAAAGVATYYLARILLGRELLSGRADGPGAGGGDGARMPARGDGDGARPSR